MRYRAVLLTLAGVLALSSLVIFPRSRHALQRVSVILRGELIDAGAYKLRVARGGRGSPAVVLESGLTYGRNSWDSIWRETKNMTRTFAYDRAGVGGSGRSPGPRTASAIVRELHLVLDKAGVRPPYVLVGHSFGGLIVRLYAGIYPDEVAGVVLINSSHEDQYALFASLLIPEERRASLIHDGGENGEGIDFLASAAEVRAAPPIPDVPSVVLTSYGSGRPRNMSRASAGREIQEAVAKWIPNGRRVIVENCGHFIQKDRPEVVIEAIRSVVEAARTAQALHSQD